MTLVLPRERQRWGDDDESESLKRRRGGRDRFGPSKAQLAVDWAKEGTAEGIERLLDDQRMPAPDRVMRNMLGTQIRRGFAEVPPNYDPAYPQALVVMTVEARGKDERDRRLAAPKSERIGVVGPLDSFKITKNHILFARERDMRTTPVGYPSVECFSNLAGLTKFDRLVVVGIAHTDQEPSDTKKNDFTAVLSGGGLQVPYTATAPIAAFQHVAVDYKHALMTETEEGQVPYHRVKGEHPMMQYPVLRPFDDLDTAVKADEVDEILHELLEDKFTRVDGKIDDTKGHEFLATARHTLKTRVFNDDGYDEDHPLPIQNYARWSAADMLGRFFGPAPDSWRTLVVECLGLLDQQNENPDFLRFMDEFGDGRDTAGENKVRELLSKSRDNRGALSEKELRALVRALAQQKNNALMEQNAWERRMILAKVTNSVMPNKGHLDLVRG